MAAPFFLKPRRSTDVLTKCGTNNLTRLQINRQSHVVFFIYQRTVSSSFFCLIWFDRESQKIQACRSYYVVFFFISPGHDLRSFSNTHNKEKEGSWKKRKGKPAPKKEPESGGWALSIIRNGVRSDCDTSFYINHTVVLDVEITRQQQRPKTPFVCFFPYSTGSTLYLLLVFIVGLDRPFSDGRWNAIPRIATEVVGSFF